MKSLYVVADFIVGVRRRVQLKVGTIDDHHPAEDELMDPGVGFLGSNMVKAGAFELVNAERHEFSSVWGNLAREHCLAKTGNAQQSILGFVYDGCEEFPPITGVGIG